VPAPALAATYAPRNTRELCDKARMPRTTPPVVGLPDHFALRFHHNGILYWRRYCGLLESFLGCDGSLLGLSGSLFSSSLFSGSLF